MINLNAERKVNHFVMAVVAAAIRDEEEGAADRSDKNVARVLCKRLGLNQYRSRPRYGDGSEARRIYTAARFLYRTELDSEPKSEI